MSWLAGLFGRPWARREIALSPQQQRLIEEWRRLPAANPDLMHLRCRYVVVDVETSGLNMKKDRLISIGAVALVDGRIDLKDSFQVVLRQDQISSHANILIHGIGGLTQSSGVEPADALLAFLRYVGKAPLVAYHAFFDQAMIEKAMIEFLGFKPEQSWIDLAWVLPDFFDFRTEARTPLDDWLRFLGIGNILRHNAVSDAYATAQLMQVAIARGVQKGAATPASFLKIEKARRWMFESR